jgi:hypothetical protein
MKRTLWMLLLGAALVSIPSVATVSRALAQTPTDSEITAKEAFEAARTLGTIDGWNAFLATFPTGFYAEFARAHIKGLGGEGPSAPVAAPAPAFPPAAAPRTPQRAEPPRLPGIGPARVTGGPTIAGCPAFPVDNIWNTRIDGLPVDPRSSQYVASIGADQALKADFGAGLYDGEPVGIPFVVVPQNQPRVPIHFSRFGDEEATPQESDPGPYPIPRNAPIEGGPNAREDRHVVVVQQGSCTLFELYKAQPNPDGSWRAVSAAKFDLEANDLRPDGWTSADAAGLPVFPGLVRYEEVMAGEIRHALRFTARRTQRAYVWPARHYASRHTDPALPPLGQRFRLKASVDISRFSPPVRVILRALQTYGMILADNGSPWFLSGAPHDGWNNDVLQREMRQLKGSDFEAVDVSSLMIEPNSAQARGR